MANSYRNILTKFQIDLSKLNPNELTAVYYDKNSHDLQFTQVGISFIASYLRPLFLPKRGFKFGVLTQSGLNDLQYNLEQLLKDNNIDDLNFTPSLRELQTDWYRVLGLKLPSPEKFITLRYVNVTNPIWTWILCTRYNDNSRILYKLYKKR